MAEQVDETVKDERLQILQRHLFAQQHHFNQACVGKTLPVLLEYPGRHAGQWIGKSPYLQSVHVDAHADLNGQMVSVKILDGHINSLSGIILSEDTVADIVTAAAVA
jgi:tRNA-2-methylthio-N6-dimethylallyladenosine synthase